MSRSAFSFGTWKTVSFHGKNEGGIKESGKRRGEGARSYVEAENDDIPVLHDVILSLAAQKPAFLHCRHAAETEKIVVGDYLGADKAPFKIRMDLSRRLRGAKPLSDGSTPGPPSDRR